MALHPVYLALLCALYLRKISNATVINNSTSVVVENNAIDQKVNSSETTLSFEKCFPGEATKNKVTSGEDQQNSRSLIRGLYKFSIKILKSLHNFESRDSSPGLLLSPFSVWSVLVVAYMGAKGDTEQELKTVLGLSDIPKHSVGMAYQGLRFWYKLKRNASGADEAKKDRYGYSVANKIFISNKLAINDCLKEHFAIEIESMDFTTEPKKARDTINQWVEKETNHKIKNLIPHDAITPWTNIVVANAIYFHSKWMNQFDPAKNQIRLFHVNAMEDVPTQMMTQTGTFMFTVSEKLKSTVLEIPYSQQDFSMLIVLPDASHGVDRTLKNLEPQDVEDIVSNLNDDEVFLALPRFKFEQEFELAGPLYSMGIKKLFDPRFSDLSGLFKSTSDSRNSSFNQANGIILNSVVHKSFISVNEEGTEAAASTAFLLARSGRPAFPTEFIVDRPFLYFIRDTSTNVILFAGIVRRPSE